MASAVQPSRKSFRQDKVEELIRTALEVKLKKEVYDSNRCAFLVREICMLIKDRAKDLLGADHATRLVVQVFVGEDPEQPVLLATRCLWDLRGTDDYAAATYRNTSLFGIAVVFGVSSATDHV